MNNFIRIGKSQAGSEADLLLRMANRHGLIAGATGTGKTVTLQLLAQRFSQAGVPVFTADIKGDLSGLADPGERTPRLEERLARLGLSSYQPQPAPVLFWDVFGAMGHPVRTTMSEIGPLLLGRILQLNQTQSEVLQVAFKYADDNGLLLLDTKDLREVLGWIGEHTKDLRGEYGNIAAATIGSIQRGLMNLAEQGGERFFGEPALQLQHLMQRDFSGNGVISILDATKLLLSPYIYSTFLLWLLSELFEELPEAGDLDKPKLVFFFDEAHLLFNDAPNSLIEKIEQVVRLIRSKGVGVYFITQNPADIPETILAQLGNRIQHALRSYTPNEQKAVNIAARSFRKNPEFDTIEAIGSLEVGEALVSNLDAQGKPTVVQRILVEPPNSKIGVISNERRSQLVSASPIAGVYDKQMDRESAFELLKQRKAESVPKISAEKTQDSPKSENSAHSGGMAEQIGAVIFGTSRRQGVAEAMVKSVARTIGSQLGREILRGVLGSMNRKR